MMFQQNYYLVRAVLTATTGTFALSKLVAGVPYVYRWWENNVLLCSVLCWEALFHPVAFSRSTWMHHICMIAAMLLDYDGRLPATLRNVAAGLEFSGLVYNVYAAEKVITKNKEELKRRFKPAMLLVTALRLLLLGYSFVWFTRHLDDKLYSFLTVFVTTVMIAVDAFCAQNIWMQF